MHPARRSVTGRPAGAGGGPGDQPVDGPTPAEDGRRRRWAGHRAARRAELVEAAVRAIRRHGPALAMDDVAAEAGVSKPILYRQFDDRTDLYLAVGQRVADSLLEEITRELEHERHPREHLAAVIDSYLRFIEAEPELYRFVVHRTFTDRPVEHDPMSRHSELVAAHLSRLIGDRLRLAGLDSGGAEPWGHGVVGLVQAAGEWWVDRRAMSRRSLTEYLTTLVWGGFASLYVAAGYPVDSRPPARVLQMVPSTPTSTRKRSADA